MKLQYNNFENVDLAALDTSISNAFDRFAFLDNFDPYSFFTTSESNTQLVGFYHDGARITVTGDHFLDDSPLVTITSIVMSRPNIDSLRVSGSVTFNYDTGLYSGFYSSFSLTNSSGSTAFVGQFNVQTTTGDIIGGTASLLKVTTDDFSFTIKGSMSVNANLDMIGGKVSDFSVTDQNGNSLSFIGMSLNAKTFDQLFDASQPDLTALFNFISANLSGNFEITAGSGDQTLEGNSGNNILDGGLGADTLIGGKGNDTYIVDNAGDVVTELANEGTDLIKASITYSLDSANGVNIENLTLTDGSANGGTAALNGTGNALANTITGNAGSNILDGGAGIDKLIGGNGNDTYTVDLNRTGTTAANFKVALQDTITETAVAGSGIDTVQLRLLAGTDYSVMANATTLTLGANLENLDASLTGSTKLNLTGNALANTLTGNDADNILDGGAGVDTLIGGDGDDTYVLDLKVSGTGVSATAVVEDIVTETSGNGTDTIKLRGSVALATATTLALDNQWANAEILDASATGATKLNLTGNDHGNILIGNAAVNILTGGTGNDTLNGGAGADTMIGGNGNDTYVVDHIADIVTEANANQVTGGTDLVKASVSYTLGANIENLELTGIAAINGTGNADANVITGNIANNILNGGAGIDTLIGGKGNDTYIVDNISDVVTELLNEGTDLVKASVSYNLAANVENLTLTDGSANGGTAALNGTGNALANTITGNAGSNILDGGAGVDKLIGGNGNDTYIVDLNRTGTTAANYKVALQDTITETAVAGSGIDTVQLRLLAGTDYSVMANATTLTLGANLENLDASLTGSTKLNLTGNAIANTLTGNDADNILDGGAGNDILIGGLGNDTLKGGAGADVFKWSLDDAGSAGDFSRSNDTVTDFSITQGDKLDLRDLLDGESGASILDYISIEASGTSTVLHISTTGQFNGGYDASEENARIVLSNTNLLTATGQSSYADAIQHMISNQSLVID